MCIYMAHKFMILTVLLSLSIMCLQLKYAMAGISVCSEDFHSQLEKLQGIERQNNLYFYNTFNKDRFVMSNMTNIWDYVNLYEALDSGLDFRSFSLIFFSFFSVISTIYI